MTMLRITVRYGSGTLTFELQGRVAVPSLQALEECWRTTLAERRRPLVRVDLTAVTFIDAAGKECLASMHRQGAELIAAGCATRDIVAEITRSSPRV
jgi:anti-anti-sigma regulatory factor